MKPLKFILAAATFAATLALVAPVQAETVKKAVLTEVDASVLTTAWRASDIIGALIYDDNGVEIGKVKDMLVAANGSVPFVIITNIPGDDQASRDVGSGSV